ncbi:hypothetical protein ACFLWY_05510, partial [Chloroflexota bacterium]
MFSASYGKSGKRDWLRWAGRVCLLVSAVGGFFVGYYFYIPWLSTLTNLDLGQDVQQSLRNGMYLLPIAGFAWVWPVPGGIIAILYALYMLPKVHMWIFPPLGATGLTLPNYYFPAYAAVYGLFMLGGIMHLVAGLREKPDWTGMHYSETGTDEKLLWAARIASLAPIAMFMLIFLFWRPWFIPFSVPFLIVAGIAWIWPMPGGVLALVNGSGWLSYILNSFGGYGVGTKVTLIVLCAIFLAGGILHLITGWRRR